VTIGLSKKPRPDHDERAIDLAAHKHSNDVIVNAVSAEMSRELLGAPRVCEDNNWSKIVISGWCSRASKMSKLISMDTTML
jgi:hypothetical protein